MHGRRGLDSCRSCFGSWNCQWQNSCSTSSKCFSENCSSKLQIEIPPTLAFLNCYTSMIIHLGLAKTNRHIHLILTLNIRWPQLGVYHIHSILDSYSIDLNLHQLRSFLLMHLMKYLSNTPTGKHLGLKAHKQVHVVLYYPNRTQFHPRKRTR